MDRISTLRNVEAALTEFEDGDIPLGTLESRVAGILRTYATEFDDGHRAVYRVHGEERDRPLVVVAASPSDARERARQSADVCPTTVERLSADESSK